MTVKSDPVEGVKFYTLITNYQAKYLIHLAMEESKMNKLIWANFTDEELMGMHGQIMATLKPEHIELLFKYIVPALEPMARKIILSGFKGNAPKEFFDKVMNTIRWEMPAGTFESMVASL